ncbi:Periplasmic protein cpxP precursor [Erwinia amylovora Ea644]|uniref:cell-envelope stress modulator CpxP n=1 Tax=Erwinia amylovora TaxID=552 RepID=UPI0002C8BD33|nr:cell-envelope stress modulator CpxP [Erwinia amylovora]CCP01213.1 Periplasmic protein cpxP precursor [Erwinia amylovora Ea644]CCP05194.1 Periplasmic protein cpxP precursor [Erwinia amylovora MR1]
MRKVTAVVVVPALIMTLFSAWAANAATTGEMHQDDATNRILRQVPQSNMFDGISLTEQQRQQMRDLMQQARYDRSPISISDLDRLHELIIADKFDEAAYEAQAKKIAHAEAIRQVEMGRVRNQMYHLLTPQQQSILQQKHQQRLDELRRLTNMQLSSPLQAASSTDSTP